jgi:class 3 adenylate cyclase
MWRLGRARYRGSALWSTFRGFTALSERVGPEVLVETTNHYLALLATAVQETGGYVDKFIVMP